MEITLRGPALALAVKAAGMAPRKDTEIVLILHPNMAAQIVPC